MIRPIGRPVSAVFLALALSLSHLPASQVRPVDLEQMTHRAARIFEGRCTGSRVEFDTSLKREVVVSTFRVHRWVKGADGSVVTVRMLAGAPGSAGSEAAGLPSFRPGDEAVLFLYGESTLGLTSPVGLGQGRFRIFRDKQGRRLALNDFGNRNLNLQGAPAGGERGRVVPPGMAGSPLDPAELLDRAQALAAGKR